MPDRVIRDELLHSERYWSVSIEAQRLFVHLILNVDDTARFSGKNFTLRSACFPGQSVEPDKLERLLGELVDTDLARVYEVNGERFVFLPRFKQKLRYVNSKYPPPPPGIDDIPEESIPDISPTEWTKLRAEVLERDGHQCIRCASVSKLSAHHMLPRSKGGKSVLDNLVSLCSSCNSWAKANEARCNEIIELFREKYYSSNAQAMLEQDSRPQKRREEKRREEHIPANAMVCDPGFEEFWRLYPRKKSKGSAERAWAKLKPNEQLIAVILDAVERAKTSAEWTKDQGQFIPYPATWLNARGWLDELTPAQPKVRVLV